MVIDSKQYNGSCACGRAHELTTQYCVIEGGCLKDVSAHMSQHGMQGYCVAVYDENTYRATADRHPVVDAEVVLRAENLHANEHGVKMLTEKLPQETEILIAIGSGTIHDITRYCAHERKIEFVSCPTAASVDGFCSSVAAMTWNGCKKTVAAVAPKIVIADLDIIKNAPIRLARSGFGDMVGKYVSLTDWKISNLLTEEFYCDTIADMTRQATENVLASAERILSGSSEAYEKLMYGLLLSGLAMQMMGNSRPASGAEHHISHLIEMNPPAVANNSDALHGEKVGVGTLLAIQEYQRMCSLVQPNCKDYEMFSEECIVRVFGTDMALDILEENRNDVAEHITSECLQTNWGNICEVISELPDLGELENLYKRMGVKLSLDEIGISQNLEDVLIRNAPMVRNRLTFMRLRKCFDL